MSHDYSAAVDPLAPYSYFDASVKVTFTAGTVGARKIVSIWSLYAANRAKGIIQPPSTLSASASALTLSVKNFEATPLSIGQARVELIPCDPGLDSMALNPQSLAVTIPPASTGAVTIAPPMPIPKGVCSYGVHLIGTSSAGFVYTDAYSRFGKENPLLRQDVTDAETIALLDQASGLTSDPNIFNEFELRQLVAQGMLPKLPAASPPSFVYDGQDLGTECVPGTPPTMVGRNCMPTHEWVQIHSEILNAFKGNFVMDHGCGAIGQLLAAVGQLYSHTSVVTKNRTHIRHSTASQDRPEDHVEASLQIDTDVMQFGFPGTDGLAEHSIDEMVHNYNTALDDPDGSGKRNISGELTPTPEKCDADTTAVPGLVIRPAIDAPASNFAVMPLVAQQALQINGHYRFFNYSSPDILPGADWATGTKSTVCSSFERLAAIDAGLDGKLWPNNTDGMDHNAPDGTRFYPTDARQSAADTLYSNQWDKVWGGCEAALGGLIYRSKFILVPALPIGLGVCDYLANRIADQTVNCFASDGCGDTGDTWEENPGSGIAVSPDDMLRWDTWRGLPPGDHRAPGLPGTYGYNEAMVYIPVAYRHKYVWTATSIMGSLTVNVVDQNNNKLTGATIILNDQVVGTTDPNGQLSLTSLITGNYNVEAQSFITPPPPPPPPADSAIPSLPLCPIPDSQALSNPSCRVEASTATFDDIGISCPEGRAKGDCVVISSHPDPSSAAGFTDLACACTIPALPLPMSCGVRHASRPAVVKAYTLTERTITLCMGPCNNGVPDACAQHCGTDSDCDVNMACTNGSCVAPLRVVHITSTSMSMIVNNDVVSNIPPVVFDCDPGGFGGSGSSVFYTFCGRDSGSNPIAQLQLSFTCIENADSSLTVFNDARLVDGCAPDSTEDEADAVQWRVDINPIDNQGDMFPSVSHVGVETCYSDEAVPPSDDCTENGAKFDIFYQSEKP